VRAKRIIKFNLTLFLANNLPPIWSSTFSRETRWVQPQLPQNVTLFGRPLFMFETFTITSFTGFSNVVNYGGGGASVLCGILNYANGALLVSNRLTVTAPDQSPGTTYSITFTVSSNVSTWFDLRPEFVGQVYFQSTFPLKVAGTSSYSGLWTFVESLTLTTYKISYTIPATFPNPYQWTAAPDYPNLLSTVQVPCCHCL